MKRGHTVLEYKSKIRRLRKIRPDISISSDFIIGFPGETEADFAATMKLIEDIGFDSSFSFIYSARPGTPAAELPDDTDEDTKKQRLQILQTRINQHAQEISRRMVGSTQSILVTGVSKKDPGQLQGRTENNRAVNFSATDQALIGQFVDVEIVDALPNSLRGRPAAVVDAREFRYILTLTRHCPQRRQDTLNSEPPPQQSTQQSTQQSLTLEPNDARHLAMLCGQLDSHLRQIEQRLGIASAPGATSSCSAARRSMWPPPSAC